MMSASLPANTGAAPKRPTPINRVAKILFMVAFLSSGFSLASLPFDRRDLGRKDEILLCDNSHLKWIGHRACMDGKRRGPDWRIRQSPSPFDSHTGTVSSISKR